jgi:hypothetical protein
LGTVLVLQFDSGVNLIHGVDYSFFLSSFLFLWFVTRFLISVSVFTPLCMLEEEDAVGERGERNTEPYS